MTRHLNRPETGRATVKSVFIRDLLRALADAEVPYCVVGGVAVNLHGVPRMTYDVDLVVPTTVEALEIGRAHV